MEQPTIGEPIGSPEQPSVSVTVQPEYAVVIFDSEYGNTEKVAHALARGLHARGISVDCVNVKEASIDKLNQYDLIGLGAPTQAFSASKRMKDFPAKLQSADLQHKSGFAFDTKLNRRLAGSAGGYVEKKMRNLGLRIVEPHFSAIVKGSVGPLEEGAEESFEKMGALIASHWRALT